MKKESSNTKSQILVVSLLGAAIFLGILVVIFFDTTGKSGSGLGDEFGYDLGSQIQTDANLILYDESAVFIETGFIESHGIATDQAGDIYVAGDKKIRKFNISGDLQDEITLNGSARCLAVTDGKIYIGMANHVRVYDMVTGQAVNWPAFSEDSIVTSIAVSKGDVFVADAGSRVVLHYDMSGELIGRIGEKDRDRNVPGFVISSSYFDLAMAKDGLLRVVSPGRHRIEAYTVDGDMEFTWGQYSSGIEGFCGCCNPAHFAILSDGGFVTSEKGLIRVKIYDSEGKFVGVVANTEQLLGGGSRTISETLASGQVVGFDVAVDNEQRVLVLDTKQNIVRIFTEKAK